MEKQTIGDRIRNIRKEKGLTQKALGEKCGMSDAQIRHYELGIKTPGYKSLFKIAYALEEPVTKFLFFDGGYIELTQDVKNRIRELRWEKELSVEQFDELLKGYAAFSIISYEVRLRIVEREIFSKIAEILGVSETYLMFGTETPPTEITTEEKIDLFFDELKEKAFSTSSTLSHTELESLQIIVREYLSLNNIGRQKVYDRIEELKELAKYTEK